MEKGRKGERLSVGMRGKRGGKKMGVGNHRFVRKSFIYLRYYFGT